MLYYDEESVKLTAGLKVTFNKSEKRRHARNSILKLDERKNRFEENVASYARNNNLDGCIKKLVGQDLNYSSKN